MLPSIIRAEGLPATPPANHVRLAAFQTDPKIAHNAGNVERTIADLRRAAAEGAAIAVFPEASLTGYCFRDADEARDLALATDGPEYAALFEAVVETEVSAVVGAIVRTDTGIANALSVLRPDGSADHYHKTHLPHLGVDRWVEAGCAALEPVPVAGVKTGLLICYDASFPEASRTLTLRGAELILLPTNWPAEAVVKADWLPNTRAYENVVYYAAVNRVGEERGYVFHGRSRVCDPTGTTILQGPTDEEAVLVCDIDPARARTKRIVRREGEYWVDRIGDRRPDLYGGPA